MELVRDGVSAVRLHRDENRVQLLARHRSIFPDLLQYDEVWAAAGTWNDNFAIAPNELVRVSGGVVTDLKRG